MPSIQHLKSARFTQCNFALKKFTYEGIATGAQTYHILLFN